MELKDIMKSIASSYVFYFNKKYGRIGHLFQDRFKSEPVNDMAYFITLLRYIHQNPVAGGIVRNVGDYTWSSWREYDPKMVCDVPICATKSVHTKISFEALEELVNTPLPKTQRILDFDCDPGQRLTDDRVREYIRLEMGISEMSEIQQLKNVDQRIGKSSEPGQTAV